MTFLIANVELNLTLAGLFLFHEAQNFLQLKPASEMHDFVRCHSLQHVIPDLVSVDRFGLLFRELLQSVLQLSLHFEQLLDGGVLMLCCLRLIAQPLLS